MADEKTLIFPVEATHIMMFRRSIGDYAVPDTGLDSAAAPPTFPRAVAQFLCEHGGADHVGEQHGGENALLVRDPPCPGEELLNRAQQGLGVTGMEEMVVAGNPGECGAGDVLGEVAALLAVLPSAEEFGYTMRAVSEITESNGSSSMASVCGGCPPGLPLCS